MSLISFRSSPATAKAALEVPESWLFWPITAGGLGLVHPLVDISAAIFSLARVATTAAIQFAPTPTGAAAGAGARFAMLAQGGGDDDDDDDMDEEDYECEPPPQERGSKVGVPLAAAEASYVYTRLL